MANVSNPLRLPEPRKARKKIDIPYNRWPERIRRAIKSFITIFIVISILVTIFYVATIDDVSLNVFFTGLSTAASLVVQLAAVMLTIIVQFGFLFWFLSRPKVQIIRPGDDSTVTFDDYWGQPQLVKLVRQWMSLLRDRKEFEKMGGKYISGLLLYGAPGTGKTLLAKAVAGESGMAFVSALGTSFYGMFWGMDILMVLRFSKIARDLAKKYGACVAYIDEIDGIGMSRSGVRGGAGGAGGTTMGGGMGMMGMGSSFALTTLLSQMDGMGENSAAEKRAMRFWKFFGRNYVPKRNWHVMWMGSTNRPDVLDPALTRSGRLDTKISVDAPDRASRRMVIEGYLKKIKCDDTVDIEALVADTVGKTPADISSAITKDAVRIAFFDGRRLVSMRDIDKAFMEQGLGMETPIEEMDEGQRRVLAYHEAGHAVAQFYVMPDQKIVRATIVRLSSGAQGHVQPVDTVEQHIEPVMRYAYDTIVSLAGRAAEKILTGQIYNSVGGDYMAVQRNLFLMARTGFFGPSLALELAGDSMSRNNKVLENYWIQLEDMTDRLLRRHWKEVTALAEGLLAHGTLSGKEVVAVIESNQSADAAAAENVPGTLAAIRSQVRAQASAGARGAAPSTESFYVPPVVGTGAGVVSAPEDVIVINGAATPPGAATPGSPPPANTPPAPAPAPAPTQNGNGNGAYAPELIHDGRGSYTPEEQQRP